MDEKIEPGREKSNWTLTTNPLFFGEKVDANNTVVGADVKSEKESVNGISRRESYIRLTSECLILFLLQVIFYLVVSIQSSLNGVIGLVSIGILYLNWIFGLAISPPLLAVFGHKWVLCFASIGFTVYVICNFYPVWATLITGSIFIGLSIGLEWSAFLSYTNQAAIRVAKRLCTSPEQYISRFHGFLYVAYGAGSVGALIPSVFILISPLQGELNETTHFSNASLLFCNDGIANTNRVEWSFYAFLSVALLIGFVVTFLSILLIRGSCNCQEASGWFSISKICHLRKSLIKIILNKRYVLALPLSFYNGACQGFFFGIFVQYYVMACIGVWFSGISVFLFGLCTSLSGFLVGVISSYSRSIPAVVIAIIHISLMIFLVLWERYPSYYVVIFSTLVWGVSDGACLSLLSIYIGVVAKGRGAEESIAFSALKATLALGAACCSFLSGILSPIVLLGILIGLLPVALPLYLVAECLYGEKCKCCSK